MALPSAIISAAVESSTLWLMTFSPIINALLSSPMASINATTAVAAIANAAAFAAISPSFSAATRFDKPFVMEPTATPSPISAAAVPHRIAAFSTFDFRLSNALLNFFAVGSNSFAALASRTMLVIVTTETV